MQRAYIILIVGAVLLISGIVISAVWAGYFASTIIRESTILADILIRPAGVVNASTQVTDTSRPVSLAIQVERVGGQIPTNTLRETVRNPNGVIMTSNEFTKQLFTTFKPDITGKYTVSIYNSGNSPVSIGVFTGNLPFIGANYKVNFNSLSGIIEGSILSIAGILVLIAGVIVLILDRRKSTARPETGLSSSSASSEATTTADTETIVLASWIDRFIAWLIDFIIISLGLGIIYAAISLPFWLTGPHSFESTSIHMNMGFWNLGAPWISYIISSVVFMGYWTYFESTTGQSIGKKLLHLKTTDLDGRRNIDVKAALIESFGKAFLLPIDVILGWIFTNNQRQRIFNRASGTIVVKIKEGSEKYTSKNVTYLKD
jgi:uncharacterized RDD family membrane protein YckC